MEAHSVGPIRRTEKVDHLFERAWHQHYAIVGLVFLKLGIIGELQIHNFGGGGGHGNGELNLSRSFWSITRDVASYTIFPSKIFSRNPYQQKVGVFPPWNSAE